MKTVLVTGSSRGLGAAIIEVFASHNWNVIINYRNSREEALRLKEVIQDKYNVFVYVYKCDVSEEKEVKALFRKIKEEIGEIDCVVNNAGMSKDNALIDKDGEEFMSVLKGNLLSTYLVSKYCLDVLKKGSIINIASDNVYHGSYIESVDYDASKAGCISLTHNFAKALAPNIRVNAVAPGWIETDMNKNIDAEFKKKEIDNILLKRFAEPKEVADAVYFLANNTYACDTILKINGGKND